MIVLSDTGFHAAEGDPANLKLCQRGEWEDRMLVETVLSMLTVVCHLHRGRKGLSPSPPSEPCWRFSRTRLSSRWFPHRDWLACT